LVAYNNYWRGAIGLASKDSSVCYHEWELISDNEASKEEVFLKCKKCGKIRNWGAGG
jgi:hypothetical protein